MALRPSHDPNSSAYPDRVFYGGKWRTQEQIERKLEFGREWRNENPEKICEANARRLYVGGMYLGRCGFTQTEREALLNGPSD